MDEKLALEIARQQLPFDRRIGNGNGREQGLGVGVGRMHVQLVPTRQFHQAP